jgi:curved DNA-binding protein CbpA
VNPDDLNAAKRLNDIREAWEILSSPPTRASYDGLPVSSGMFGSGMGRMGGDVRQGSGGSKAQEPTTSLAEDGKRENIQFKDALGRVSSCPFDLYKIWAVSSISFWELSQH